MTFKDDVKNRLAHISPDRGRLILNNDGDIFLMLLSEDDHHITLGFSPEGLISFRDAVNDMIGKIFTVDLEGEQNG